MRIRLHLSFSPPRSGHRGSPHPLELPHHRNPPHHHQLHPPDLQQPAIEPSHVEAKKPLHLSYTISDHLWIDSADCAAVRITMTVAAPGKAEGILENVTTDEGIVIPVDCIPVNVAVFPMC